MSAFVDKRLLLTGASSGIGLSMARILGLERARLVLVARGAERLEALASEIRAAEPTAEVTVLPADLTQLGACDEVFRRASAGGPIDFLINNAGVGEYGAFAAQDVDAVARMLQLNIDGLVRLSRLCLPGMLGRRSGRIVNVASMAGFQPFPYMTVYAASKAFVIDFSLGLHEELRGSGVGVTCVCPGTTRTGFFERGGYEQRRGEFLKVSATPESVAAECVRAIARGKLLFVPGRGNKVAAVLQRILPARLLARLLGRVMKPKL